MYVQNITPIVSIFCPHPLWDQDFRAQSPRNLMIPKDQGEGEGASCEDGSSTRLDGSETRHHTDLFAGFTSDAPLLRAWRRGPWESRSRSCTDCSQIQSAAG